MNQTVGKIKRIIYDEEEDELEVLVKITDKKFQKKLLRDLTLSGNLKFEDDRLTFESSEEKKDA